MVSNIIHCDAERETFSDLGALDGTLISSIRAHSYSFLLLGFFITPCQRLGNVANISLSSSQTRYYDARALTCKSWRDFKPVFHILKAILDEIDTTRFLGNGICQRASSQLFSKSSFQGKGGILHKICKHPVTGNFCYSCFFWAEQRLGSKRLNLSCRCNLGQSKSMDTKQQIWRLV